VASVEECEDALHRLAARLAASDGRTKKRASLDRTLSCRLRDLDVVFGGRLKDGELLDIRRVDDDSAQVRMAMASDDLLRLVDGELNLAGAIATGRVRLDAGVFDLVKLRSIF
jgi:hypothetical protein